jgi:hypothetical protein
MMRIFGLEMRGMHGLVWRQQDGRAEEVISQYRRGNQGPLVYLALKGIITFAYGLVSRIIAMVQSRGELFDIE